MDEIRKGEIALAILRKIERKEGIMINPSRTKRELGNLSKETGIPIDELVVFYKEEALNLIDQL